MVAPSPSSDEADGIPGAILESRDAVGAPSCGTEARGLEADLLVADSSLSSFSSSTCLHSCNEAQLLLRRVGVRIHACHAPCCVGGLSIYV